MYLFNTLSREKEEFKPLKENEVRIYTCGMTVQDAPHLGHLRTFIFADVLRRFFEFLGYKVIYIQNFTDIDDKIIQRAKEEKIDWRDIGQRYIDEYFYVSDLMNIKRADAYPKASQFILEMINLIQKLLKKGYAYKTKSGIYFEVEKFKTYGKLSKKKIDELLAGARVEVDEEKKNPLDFALWKSYKENEPYWYAPFGRGRPGWHIECSAMSMHYLGETFDIHIGGEDLIFPHHENEIAQSEAATNKPFVKYFLHNGLLLLKGEKMAKSTKNYFLAKEALREYEPDIIRLFLLKAHYRSPYEFTTERLEEAKSQWQRIKEFFIFAKKGKEAFRFIVPEKIVNALLDDLNTPFALGEIFKMIEEFFKTKDLSLYSLVYSSLKLLGFKLTEKEPLYLTTEDNIENLIKARTIARKNKKYDISDKIRTALNYLGYELRDTNEETIFFKKEEKEVNKEEFKKIVDALKKEIEEQLKEEEFPYLKEILELIKEY
ncbi:MAG: cysteine--tRNA ligase [candidate division WOR-3 bacterium]|nr:cysteine--tRNA ligase [candidate division WOR-3 bacterium]MDW8113304.1 cysteine--tRNA ligase [candidate division WOR-3 bacterium]